MPNRFRRSQSVWRLVAALALALAATACEASLDRDAHVPWDLAPPESVGLDAARLDSLTETLAAEGTTALLVVRHNRIAWEWYAPDHGPDRKEGTASLAKSLVAGMALLLALDDGRIGLDDSVARYVPEWRSTHRKSRITVRQLATHSSGLAHRTPDGATEWERAFGGREPGLFRVALDDVPVVFEPGSDYLYSGPGFAVLSYVITASLRDAPRADLRGLLEARIMAPTGVPPDAWSIGYGRAFEQDGMTLYAGWSGGDYTARAAARVGQLMLQKGSWNGRPLVDSTSVRRMLSDPASPSPGPGEPVPAVCWWVNRNGAWRSLPRDAFAGAGAGGQILLVVPSLDLVAVRYGRAPGGQRWGPGLWRELDRSLFGPLVAAVRDRR